ncbi:MAG: polyketide synthase of type I, partial [Chitinivibrionales bacterium]|nr:polyketide synthase of type I [Chitinivibrionales bacterium]
LHVISDAPGKEENEIFTDPVTLHERSEKYLRKMIAEMLRMKASKINPDQPLSDYGLDSILIVQLTNKLREYFPDITSTLLFEAGTVNKLVSFFIKNDTNNLKKLINYDELSDVTTISRSDRFKAKSAQFRAINPYGNMRRSKRDPLNIPKLGYEGAYEDRVFDVAVIGVSGRYPGASTLREFWENLSSGINCITEIPRERWNWEKYFDPEKGKAGRLYTQWGGFLDDIDKFDPLFFKIAPKEAKRMDPQERLFLECCYHAIEDAGYTPNTLGSQRDIGVFVGVMNSRYTPQPSHYSIANRISYLFDFQGPSMAIDTACSSSLSAIHVALESMYSKTTSCAIAGGVNLIIDPGHYIQLSEMTMLSRGNRCKAFGENADGFVAAEAVGAVILKPLTVAEKDGDQIYGIIKGSAVNAGGKTNGYTVPNPQAQAAVIKRALERARVKSDELSYIEAHGTGTALGDPIEIAGLTNAFNELSDKKGYCSIGSVKSNIGHAESAAGIAGLTKVIMQFKHGKLVPSLYADAPNPEIDFSKTPFLVQKSREEWRRREKDANGKKVVLPRMAGISSFGAGGANAHLIVQEYDIDSTEMDKSNHYAPKRMACIPLSARNENALNRLAKNMLEFLHATEVERGIDLNSIAYTLQTGREAMDFRLGFAVDSIENLIRKLSDWCNGERDVPDVHFGNVKKTKEAVSFLNTDDDLQQAIDKWIISKKMSKLIEAWVKGLEIDWLKLYSDAVPKRVSLPGYPFARERYWKTETSTAASGVSPISNSFIHPLVHENISDLKQQRYRTGIKENEYIHGNKDGNTHILAEEILAVAVYLEMARAAIEHAIP